MAARTGMAGLIRRLRQMCEAGASDYTLNGVTYWSDDDLQNKLDEHRVYMTGVKLIERPQYVDGVHVYKRYEIPREIGNAVEAPDDATIRVYDSVGATVDSDDYTWNERDLSVEFDADQEGVAYYFDGYIYDLTLAAREIWLAKAAHMHSAINFSADGHRFDREALYKHCIDMAKVFGYREGGASSVSLKASMLVRTDLAESGSSPF